MTSEVCGLFVDSEFVHAFDELDVPDVDGWEFFTASHNIIIYRLYNEVLYTFLGNRLWEICVLKVSC